MRDDSERPRRVLAENHGPLLVEGPVTFTADNGESTTSDRFMVAVCTCRRSRVFPWCDTSHRRRSGPCATASAEADRAPDRGRP